MRIFRLLASNLFVFITILFAVTVVSWPIYENNLGGIFHSIDPDAVYVANALSYIKNGVIGYFDHPGTPAIKLISYYYIPVRLFAKFYLHQPFITFYFENVRFLFAYTRMAQSLVFAIGLFVFSLAIKKNKKTITSSLLGILLLFCFTPVYFASNSISAEALLVLFCAIWIFVFSIYLKRKEISWLYVMIFLGGLLFAERATTFFYITSSLCLLIVHEKTLLLDKILRGLFGIILFITGFLLGISPFIDKAWQILSRIFFFASSSGVHGSISTSDFISLYADSFKTFFIRDPLFIIVFFFLLVVIFRSYRYDRNTSLGIVAINCLLGMLVFAKFPLAHYQLANYLLGVYILVLSIPTKKYVFEAGLLLTLLVAQPIYKNYISEINRHVQTGRALESYLVKNENTVVVTGWVRSEDFVKLWIRDWGGVFVEELGGVSNLFELESDLKNVRINSQEKLPLEDLCWDYFILQDSMFDDLLKNNTIQILKYPIQGSESLIDVKRLDCDKKMNKNDRIPL